MSITNEVSAFNELAEKIVTDWSKTAHATIENLFNGAMKAYKIVDGISDYASLIDMMKDGKWSRNLKMNNLADYATKAVISHIIPIALRQNDKVRPVLM